MSSPRDLRRRIKSISSTAQITKAMQMVAASKMRKAQQAALAVRAVCAAAVPHPAQAPRRRPIDFAHPLLEVREVRKRAVILSRRDKGLCGALNTQRVPRWRRSSIRQSTVFITAGRKAAQFVARTRRQLAAEFAYGDTPTFAEARAIAALRPRPLPEGRGGRGADRRHAVRQHADAGAVSARVPAGRRHHRRCKIPERWTEEALAADTDGVAVRAQRRGRARLSARALPQHLSSTSSC